MGNARTASRRGVPPPGVALVSLAATLQHGSFERKKAANVRRAAHRRYGVTSIDVIKFAGRVIRLKTVRSAVLFLTNLDLLWLAVAVIGLISLRFHIVFWLCQKTPPAGGHPAFTGGN